MINKLALRMGWERGGKYVQRSPRRPAPEGTSLCGTASSFSSCFSFLFRFKPFFRYSVGLPVTVVSSKKVFLVKLEAYGPLPDMPSSGLFVSITEVEAYTLTERRKRQRRYEAFLLMATTIRTPSKDSSSKGTEWHSKIFPKSSQNLSSWIFRSS